MKFDFATATQIIFGVGRLREIGPLTATLGSRALVVGGATPERLVPLLELLHAAQIPTRILSIPTEPTPDMVMAGVQQARAGGCDVVVGMGGGSVLDAGKAIAALLTNPNDISDYLEVVGRNLPLTEVAAPYIAIPTTAGTGSEVTRNAVLALPEQQVKVSLRSPWMLPRVALIDPELSHTMPPAITASTGLDALTQCLEPYVTAQANPLSDAFCREGMQRVARALRRAYLDGHDAAARTDMALASLCGGLALANAKLGAVHGFAAPLGAMFPVPHGMVCAQLLPLVMAANIQALQQRAPDGQALQRYAEIARILTSDPNAQAADGVSWVRHLCMGLHVPPLGQFGITAAAIPTVVERAQQASSMQGNPIVLTAEELTHVLNQAL